MRKLLQIIVVAVTSLLPATRCLAEEHADSCWPPCTKVICVPEPAKKKITKTLYSCKAEDFCLPKCRCSMLFKHGCNDCCIDCEKPRKRVVLLKKIETKECDYLKCVPVVVPVEPCCPPCAQPTPQAETIPAMPKAQTEAK